MEQPSTSEAFESVNGIRLHLLQAGPEDGTPVLLLHGFPEFFWSWRLQMPFFAEKGFRVIAPDLRGYNLSDKPKAVGDYRIDCLIADVLGLIDQCCHGKVMLVGHDWGGVIAWFVAMRHPDRIAKLVVLNAPHPAAYLRELRRPCQLLRSWYVFFLQLPWLPELLLRAGNYSGLRKLFRDGQAAQSPKCDSVVQTYIDAISQPGALTSIINYYRAAMRSPFSTLRGLVPIQVPTLLIWGMQDRYLTPRLTTGLEKWVPNLRVERLHEATHWVQHDEPDKVNQILGEFLCAGGKFR